MRTPFGGIAATTYSPAAAIAPTDGATVPATTGIVAAQLFYNLGDHLSLYWELGPAHVFAPRSISLSGCARSGHLVLVPVPVAPPGTAATLHIEIASDYGEAHVQRTFVLSSSPPPVTTTALPPVVALDGRHVVAEAAYFIVETADTHTAWRGDDIDRVHVLGPALRVPCVDPSENAVIRVEAVMADGSVRDGYLQGHRPRERSPVESFVLGGCTLVVLAAAAQLLLRTRRRRRRVSALPRS